MDLKELNELIKNPINKEEQVLDEIAPPIENKVMKDNLLGQHRILDIVADDYDKVLELCSGLGYTKILKVKRLPYHTHTTTCPSLLPSAKDKNLAPCNCYYVDSKEPLRPLPITNHWKVTVMAQI